MKFGLESKKSLGEARVKRSDGFHGARGTVQTAGEERSPRVLLTCGLSMLRYRPHRQTLPQKQQWHDSDGGDQPLLCWS